MEGQHTYDHILKQKLNQLEAPGMDSMWEDMHAMLDKNMPQEKKRRFIVWFFNRYMIMLLTLAVSSVTVSWYALSKKSNSSETIISSKEITTSQTTAATTQAVAEGETKTTISGNNKEKSVNVSTTAIASKVDKNITIVHNESGQKETPSSFITPISLNTIVPSENETIQFKPSIAKTQKLSATVQDRRNKLASEKSHVNVNIISSIQASVNLIARKAITTAVSSNEPENIITHTTDIAEVEANDQNINIKRINTAATTIPAELNPFPASNNVQLRMVGVDPNSLKIEPFKRRKQSYFVAGLAVNYHVPVSGQEMSTVTSMSNQNRFIDYLPSVYTQYHLNEKWYIQAEFQYTSPQYIHPLKMESIFTPISANKKKEESVSLSKLYYLNLPVSIHYKPNKKMSIGTGIQYSYLRNSIIESEICTWENSNNSWSKSYVKKNVFVKSNPRQEKRKNANDPSTPLSPVDTLAQSLRTNDWRIVLDVNYKWRNLTGGARFNTGLNNYIDISSGGVSSSLKDKNEAFQLYLRYDLFRSDRKRK